MAVDHVVEATAPSIVIERAPFSSTGEHVYLNEERARVELRRHDNDIDTAWHLDTGASNHMTGDELAFAELRRSVTGTVRFGDGSLVDIKGRDTVMFSIDGGRHKALTGVYWIPRLKTNIISIGQLDEIGCPTLVKDGKMTVRDQNRRIIAQAPRLRNRLYVVHLKIERPICLAAHAKEDAWIWHARFGHQGFDGLNKLATKGMVRGLPAIAHVEELCEACLAGKHRRAPFPQVAKYRATAPLELVHGDLCGPISPATPGGNRYFLLLVDDFSRFMWIKLLRTKDEAADAIRRFQASAEVESRHTLRVFRTDRGGEFTATEFMGWCADHGIKRHLTAPYSPQQNGVVERRNQTVVGTARCMLKGATMPARFWGEAVTTAVFLLNRSFARSVEGRTPYEAWHGAKPDVKYLRVFGCKAHAKVTRPDLKKLDDRSKPMVMLGYEPGGKAYRLYDPVAKRVHVSRDVVFDETRSWDWDGSGVHDGEETEFTVEYSYDATPARVVPEPATTSAAPRHLQHLHRLRHLRHLLHRRQAYWLPRHLQRWINQTRCLCASPRRRHPLTPNCSTRGTIQLLLIATAVSLTCTSLTTPCLVMWSGCC